MKKNRGRLFLGAAVMLLTVTPMFADAWAVVWDKEAVYEARHRATYSPEWRLPETTVDEMTRFLTRSVNDDAVREDELAALKNNIADLLLQQEVVPPRLLDTFAAQFADVRQGLIWREYIVQKIPELAVRLHGDEQQAALDFLRQRTESTDYIFAGTALLGLGRLNQTHPEAVPAAEVARRARSIFDSEQQAEASRLTALQILAKHDAPAALLRARALLVGDTPVMLKTSALATLGMVGEADDHPLLNRYARSPELRLRTSARAALIKIDARGPVAAIP